MTIITLLICIIVVTAIVPTNIQGQGFFVRTLNLTTSNWFSAVFDTNDVGVSLVECASLCHQYEEFESGNCNAFYFHQDDLSCSLAKLTFLEDEQPNIESQMFHARVDSLIDLKLYCYGGEHCCRPENQCGLNEGDCNTEDDCSGWGYICGNNNCKFIGLSNRDGGLWDEQDDCCERRCMPEHQCPMGYGDCDNDDDCKHPTWQKCEQNGCLNRNYFPLDKYPDNTENRFSSSDDCCRKRCYPHEQCGHNVEGCETDDDCSSGLECLATGFCYDIDECSEDVGTGLQHCGSNTICTNSIGSFSCSCNSGYQNHVANQGCSDVDECSTNQFPKCQANSDCVNLIGNYECICSAGYTGNPYVGCTDIDECALGIHENCKDNSHCVNTIGSYDCDCNAGYEGNPYMGCTDIDECAESHLHGNCVDYSSCINTIGSYECACIAGHEGNPYVECMDINECDLAPNNYENCKANSHCVNIVSSYNCACNSGYNGDPYVGCIDVDECATAENHPQCQDNTNCINTDGSYECECKPGYSGNPYEVNVGCPDINECASPDLHPNCKTNSYCYNTHGDYICYCNTGYAGNPYADPSNGGCDTEECNCKFNSKCTLSPGPTCQCNGGYVGDPTVEGKNLFSCECRRLKLLSTLFRDVFKQENWVCVLPCGNRTTRL